MLSQASEPRHVRCGVAQAFALFGLLALLSCTSPAEHSNPLDPQSPEYTTQGSLAGFVTSFYPPYQPLAGARLELQPQGVIVQSDGEGFYSFGELARGHYTLAASAAGYAPRTVSTEVVARQTRTETFRLDALPEIVSARALSIRVATRASETPFLFLDVAAAVSDRDGANDVARVRVEIPAMAFGDTLARASIPGNWQRVFSSAELAGGNFYDLIGEPMRLVAQDLPGAQGNSSPFYLARIISDEPHPLAPANGEVITNRSPLLRWQLPAIPFEYELTVEVFRLDAGFPVLILTVPKLAAGTNNLPYPGSLATGSYFWTVKIIDSHGNSSRSQEAFFQVQ